MLQWTGRHRVAACQETQACGGQPAVGGRTVQRARLRRVLGASGQVAVLPLLQRGGGDPDLEDHSGHRIGGQRSADEIGCASH